MKLFKSRKFVVMAVLLLPVMFAFWFLFLSNNTYAIKRTDAVVQGDSVNVSSKFTIAGYEKDKIFESPVFTSDYEFNAIAPHWKEKLGAGASRTVYVRTSKDNTNWTDWMDIEVDGPAKDNDPHKDEVFPETPIFIEGSYYQYKV